MPPTLTGLCGAGFPESEQFAVGGDDCHDRGSAGVSRTRSPYIDTGK